MRAFALLFTKQLGKKGKVGLGLAQFVNRQPSLRAHYKSAMVDYSMIYHGWYTIVDVSQQGKIFCGRCFKNVYCMQCNPLACGSTSGSLQLRWSLRPRAWLQRAAKQRVARL